MNELLRKEDFIHDASLPVGVIRRSPQPDYPLHTHEFSELVIVYHGEGLHYGRDGEGSVKAGDVFVLRGAMEHGYRKVRDLKLINILFDPDALGSPLAGVCNYPAFRILYELTPGWMRRGSRRDNFSLNPEQLARLTGLVDELENEIATARTGYRIMIVALFLQLAAWLCRYYEKLPQEQTGPALHLSRAISFMERNYMRAIRIEELARMVNMSESTLTRAFVRYTGKTPVNYLISLRIQRACTLLTRYGRKTIAETGYEAGFADSNYFSRQFKKNTGMTPGEYRRRNRGR